MQNKYDTLEHFLFEDTFSQAMPIRGNLVRINQTQQQALQHQALPKHLRQALGELMAACALLSATLKMEGSLIMQLQSKGAIPLLVVECGSDLCMRATAKWDTAREAEIESKDFLALVKNGHFAITLDPTEGEAYQGIVPIEGATIAEMLQNYMLRSQQIDTSLWLQSDGESAAGMLLQKLPNHTEHDQGAHDQGAHDQGTHDLDAWNRINQLANTVTPAELSTLTSEVLLQRLFYGEEIRLFKAREIKAHCSCTREHVANMLKMLGEPEVNSIIEEQGSIQINCDFCNKLYVFDENEASGLFHPTAIHTKH
ncbi:MAG: Hsp33 family molecular chaperone HslO [Methylophilus sp.]|nr:Hsp33 family molecular chaperone HslO [Methylophilus sp.]